MSLLHAVGQTSAPVCSKLERGRLRLFARAIGETDPVYVDVIAARAAGYPDLLAPLTYLFGTELEGRDPFAFITELGVDLRDLLHGEQEFTYLSPVYAGEHICVSSRIVDCYEKKGGQLQFLVRVSEVTRNGDLVAVLRATWIVRSHLPDGASDG